MIAISRNLTQNHPGSSSKPHTQREYAGIWKTGILHKSKVICQKNFWRASDGQEEKRGADEGQR
jgi:hypothetical protein